MSSLQRRRKTPEICPVCGEDVPGGALACPECGADHESGWRADAAGGDGLDLPEEEFDYEKFVEEEFGMGTQPSGLRMIWWCTAMVVLAGAVALYVLSLR